MIHSLNLPSLILLIQPRRLLPIFAAMAHSWLLCKTLLAWPPGLSCRPAPQAAPQSAFLQGLLPYQVQDFIFSSWHFISFLLTHSFSLSRPLWMAVLLLSISIGLPILSSGCKFDESALSCLLQVTDKDVR